MIKSLENWKNYKTNENKFGPYEPMAKTIMDLVDQVNPGLEPSQFAEIEAHDDKFEEYDEKGMIDKWLEERPYADITDKSIETFIQKVKETIPELTNIENDKISNIVSHCYAEYWYGNGAPYMSELGSISNQLAKLLDTKNTNENNEVTDNKFTYMMLGRLSTDNDYYLGHGNRSEKSLWAGNVDAQIEEMKRLWNILPQDAKPQWLSMEDILEYERKMKEPLTTNEAVSEKGIQKKVDEINDMIAKAKDEDGDAIGVVDTSGTWQSAMYYKPIEYKNGKLYIQYEEQGTKGITKDVINKANMEMDGIPTLNNIAKMYRKVIKKTTPKMNEKLNTWKQPRVNENVESEYNQLFNLLKNLSEAPEDIQNKHFTELAKISGKWSLVSREMMAGNIDLYDLDLSDLESNLSIDDVKASIEYLSANKGPKNENITGDSDSLPNVLSSFRSDINVASRDQHDIESAYEEIMASYKDQYPQFTTEIDAEWNKMCVEAEKEMDNLKPKNNSNEGIGTSTDFTPEEVTLIQTVNPIKLNEVGLYELGGGEFCLIKHFDGVIEMLRYDDTTSTFQEFKTYNTIKELVEDLKDNKFQKENKTNESLKKGDTIIFNTEGRPAEFFQQETIGDDKLKELDGKIATIEEVDGDFCDIMFSDGTIMAGIHKKFLLNNTNENTDVQTNTIFEFTSADVLFDDQKDYILYDLEEILKLLAITEEKFHELVMFSKEDSLLQGKESELFKFINMVRTLYTPILTIDNNMVYDINGVKVWISDINANLCIYINSRDLEAFNEQLMNIL